MIVRVAPWLAVLGCAEPPCEVEEYVAMQEDFAAFETWPRFDVDAPDPRLGGAARSVYISRLPPPGATSFPVCTKIVKVGREGDDPTQWLMVAMAKRGGGYNADGAVGWEWFDIDVLADGTPVIDWRGPAPPAGQGYECALGEDEAGAEGVGDCNTCHGVAAANDFVLDAALRLADR